MEYRKRCQVCGKIFCYTDKDLKDNVGNAALSALSALGGLASIFGGGTIFHTAYGNRNSQYYGDKVVDYDKCPYCGSKSIADVSDEEWSKEQKQLTSEMGNVRRVEINSNATPEMLLKRAALFLEDEEWSNADAYAEAALDVEPENTNAYVVKLMAELKVKELPGLTDCKEPFDDNNNFKKAMRFGDDETKAFLTGCISQINERNKTQLSEQKYSEAVSLMKEAKTEQQYKQAAERFGTIASYKDAGNLVEECNQNAETARKDDIYNSALKIMNGGTPDVCQKALELFNTIRGWKDTDEQVIICQKKIEELKRQEAQRQQEAQLKAKKAKKIGIIFGSLVCAVIAIGIVFNTVIVPGNQYKKAVALMDEGNVVEAYETLVALGDYKDSSEKAASIRDDYNKAMIKRAKTGDYIILGEYEQDYDISNGMDDLEWLVLDVKEGRALVVSKYAIKVHEYNNNEDVTWKNSAIRKWLNDDFFSEAFSDDEKKMIPTVIVSADKNPNYDTNPGKATRDKIFLLSISEANHYFSSDAARQCRLTKYAASGGFYGDYNRNCFWWLRTPGYNDCAAAVRDEGDIKYVGQPVDYDGYGVRPAMWIDLDA
ncbi:MAG: DUF6273 domain-containing protein [Treponema sp.]|nr:DUF6273 domain-containing protein [Treponema sp.]